MTDLDEVRDWVGNEPNDATLNAALARFDAESHPTKRAALSILRRRYADLEGGPAAVSIADDASWSTRKDQADSLARKINVLARELGETGVAAFDALTSAPLVGPENYR